jgi:CBS domain-containing protein
MLRLFLRVQVVEVAEEFVEPVVRRQHLVTVTQVVLAELAGHSALGLEQSGDRWVLLLHALGRTRQSDLGEAGRMGDCPVISAHKKVESVLQSLAHKKVQDILNRPAICIEEEKQLTEAVDLMPKRNLKRLPVVDASGKLVGMLSRMDIFCAITRECPSWKAFREQEVHVGDLHLDSDIMRRDTHAVLPETPIEEVIQIIHSNDIQGVAELDREGHFLGLISDRALLAAFSDPNAGIWDTLVSKMAFTESGRRHREFIEQLRARTASEVMDASHVTVAEDATIEEAIRIMTERGLKRLPVVDTEGVFKGMISRESLLRKGFGNS